MLEECNLKQEQLGERVVAKIVQLLPEYLRLLNYLHYRSQSVMRENLYGAMHACTLINVRGNKDNEAVVVYSSGNY